MATTQVIFTGDWSMPVKEAEATNSLIDQGVDVPHLSRRRAEDHGRDAARRGAMVLRLSRQPVAAGPKAYLTGADWNWKRSIQNSSDDRAGGLSRTSIAAA